MSLTYREETQKLREGDVDIAKMIIQRWTSHLSEEELTRERVKKYVKFFSVEFPAFNWVEYEFMPGYWGVNVEKKEEPKGEMGNDNPG